MKKNQRLSTIFHSTTHLSIDFFLSFFAPTLPVLIANLDLLKIEVGILSMSLQLAALTMPFFGRIADKKDIRKYMFLTPAVTAICMSVMSIIPNFSFLLIVMLVGGISIYFYHAIGPADMGGNSSNSIGQSMAIWNIAGQVGFMAGPLLISWILSSKYSKYAPFLSIGGVIVSLILYFIWKQYSLLQSNNIVDTPQENKVKSQKLNKNIFRQFLPVLAIIITNTFIRTNVYNYFPVFLVEHGASLWISGLAVSIYSGSGIFGQYIGGILYDKFGAKWVIAISIIGFALSFATSTILNLNLQLFMTLLSGFFSFMLIPTIMAMLQDNFPENRSLMVGLFLGFVYSLTALAGIVSGYFLDRIITQRVFLFSSLFCLFGLLFIPFLKSSTKTK